MITTATKITSHIDVLYHIQLGGKFSEAFDKWCRKQIFEEAAK